MNRLALVPISKPAAVLTVFFLITGLTGCEPAPEEIANGDDPIEALKVPVVSTRYTGDFWMREHEQNPERYAEATAFCEGKEFADYPNCREVMRAETTIRALESPRLEGKTYSGQSTAPPHLQSEADTMNQQ